jgi:hypothetical protein
MSGGASRLLPELLRNHGPFFRFFPRYMDEQWQGGMSAVPPAPFHLLARFPEPLGTLWPM